MAIHLPFPNSKLSPKNQLEPQPIFLKFWMESIIASVGIVGFILISALIFNDQQCVKTQQITIHSSQVIDASTSPPSAAKKNVHSLTAATYK